MSSLKHIPIELNHELLDISIEDFKNISKDIKELFKKVYDLNPWDNLDDNDIYEKVLNIFHNEYATIIDKYNIDNTSWLYIDNEDRIYFKRLLIVSMKMAIFDNMVSRYYNHVAFGNITSKYINPKIEKQICKIMINDKTGYIRAKNQIHDLAKYMTLHEVNLRKEEIFRTDVFPYEKQRGKIHCTYKLTADYFAIICPNKINSRNIIWRII